MARTIAIVALLLVGSAGADSGVASPAAAEGVASSLRGAAAAVNVAEKVHAPPDWHPPSTGSAMYAFAAMLALPVVLIAASLVAKKREGWWPCCLVAVPILVFWAYTMVAYLEQ
eukprot:CAMPEP_0179351910 /NCGR_PEP_ID=MMETSP0797-20121207/75525_1 /TAXON_ID=47934 /ORGANISM="Dinophysis acuminata, Strain DAEP01" /LENGTH=113 /DNA_ID=CAMNT_0021066889 /DNA_START=44 /DNA_END=385 /DNA_ORIENTATION=+